MARKRWVDSRVDVMLPMFEEAGYGIDRDELAKLLEERVDRVASQLGIGIESARRTYFDDDQVRAIAAKIIADVPYLPAKAAPPASQSVASSERELDYAYIRELDVKLEDSAMHYTFIRLTRAGESTPANSATLECEVDFDEDGHVIGVTIITMGR